MSRQELQSTIHHQSLCSLDPVKMKEVEIFLSQAVPSSEIAGYSFLAVQIQSCAEEEAQAGSVTNHTKQYLQSSESHNSVVVAG